MGDGIGVDADGGVLAVTIDRPDRGGSLRAADMAALARRLRGAARRRPGRSLLRSEGRHFCTGADLSNAADRNGKPPTGHMRRALAAGRPRPRARGVGVPRTCGGRGPAAAPTGSAATSPRPPTSSCAVEGASFSEPFAAAGLLGRQRRQLAAHPSRRPRPGDADGSPRRAGRRRHRLRRGACAPRSSTTRTSTAVGRAGRDPGRGGDARPVAHQAAAAQPRRRRRPRAGDGGRGARRRAEHPERGLQGRAAGVRRSPDAAVHRSIGGNVSDRRRQPAGRDARARHPHRWRASAGIRPGLRPPRPGDRRRAGDVRARLGVGHRRGRRLRPRCPRRRGDSCRPTARARCSTASPTSSWRTPRSWSCCRPYETGAPVSSGGGAVYLSSIWTRYYAGWTDKLDGSVVTAYPVAGPRLRRARALRRRRRHRARGTARSSPSP